MATSNLAFVPSSTKRHRTSSQSSGPLSDSSANVNFKSTRISTSPPSDAAPISEGTAVGRAPSHRLICTLPPTCNRSPTPLGSTKELESHYSTYHAHVCEEPGCGCVFPEPRLLELHQTENHDPLAALRKERGERIFLCHLPTCPKAFMTPKTRRLHLISAHGYPKEYFFAVTNKGVGGLLKKWGEGASMIRKTWKARDDPKPTDGPKKGSSAAMEVDSTSYRDSMDVDQDDTSSDDSSDDHDHDQGSEGEIHTKSKQSHPRLVPLHNDNRMALDPEATPRLHPSSKPLPSVTPPTKSTPLQPSADADGLAAGFSSLSLVPPSVRFGRGGRSSGFVSRSERRLDPQPDATPTPAQSVTAKAAPDKRGRGGGGPNRGRGGAKVPNATESTADAPVHAESIERGRGRGRGARSRGRGTARGA